MAFYNGKQWGSYADITDSQNLAISNVADKLNIPFKWLRDLIFFESKGDPSATNPLSSAKGLIQFIDSTAKDLGYNDSLDLIKKEPTFEDQIGGSVYKYLKRYAPFKNNVEFTNAVFYPKYRKKINKEFPLNIQRVNAPYGITIKTPIHYTAFTSGKLREFNSGRVSQDQIVEENPTYKNSVFAPLEILPGIDTKKKILIIGLTASTVALYYLLKRK